ncbi:RDD family protein [Cellulomonas sp. P4]|uniref:RDD family protein n=1 Tax=Cellulomonas sp. P4 TaxID=3142533 RepID=UPI0031BAA3BE
MSAVPVATLAVCASCRRPLQPGARFCTACGAPAQPDATVTLVEGAQGRSRSTAAAREPRPAVLHPAFGDATPAAPVRRVLAYAVDAVAVGAVAGGLLAWTGSWLLAGLVVVELAVGLVVWEAHTGRTLGNTALGLRTAREETPYSVGPARAFLRGLVLTAGHAVAGLGQWVVVASGAFDRTGRAQGWHDRVGRAVVVDVRAHERAAGTASDAAERDHAGAAVVEGRGGAVAPVASGLQVGAPGAWGTAPAVASPGPVAHAGGVPGPTAAPAGQVVASGGAGAAPGGLLGAAASAPPAAVPAAVPPTQGAVGTGAGPAGTPTEPAAPLGRRAARAAAERASSAAGTPPAAASASQAPSSAGIRPVVPGPAPVEPLPAAAPRVADRAQPAPFLVTLDTGQVMSVTGPGLIGRAPRPTPGERCDHVIVVEDPERSVSRTHARFGIEAGTFWVSDAGSGNGTTLRLPSGRVVPVPTDQRVPVPSGSTIQVGDRGVRIDAPEPRG